jgi:hypothetical protein
LSFKNPARPRTGILAELPADANIVVPRRSFQQLQPGAPLCADPKCSISRDPRREEYTICTAVAPDDVFTVRTYGTRQLYEPG